MKRAFSGGAAMILKRQHLRCHYILPDMHQRYHISSVESKSNQRKWRVNWSTSSSQSHLEVQPSELVSIQPDRSLTWLNFSSDLNLQRFQQNIFRPFFNKVVCSIVNVRVFIFIIIIKFLSFVELILKGSGYLQHQ